MHQHWPLPTRKRLRTWQLALLLATLSSVTVGGVMWHITQVRAHLLERSARTYAELYALALTELRSAYTQNVVEIAVRHGLTATHDYARRANAIPMPSEPSKRPTRYANTSKHLAYRRHPAQRTAA